jgi:tetratricopeptide (TPR) repeat protein
VFPVVGVTICLLLAAALAPDAPAAPTPAPHVDRGPTVTDVPTTKPSGKIGGRTLAELRQSIGSPDAAARQRAIEVLLAAIPDDAQTLHEYLHRKTGVPSTTYKSLLRSIGAQVPDRAGHFAALDTEHSLDWLTALRAVDPASKRSSQTKAALAEATLSIALLRALAATRRHEGAVSIIRFAFRHQGAFKDECGRQLRSMGTYAVPGLLRARSLKDPLAYKITRYAAYQLDRLDCARPDRALKQNDQDLQAEVLHAYGEVRDPSAVSAVLAYTNDPSERVRRAARWAMLRYVSGRPPRVVKRKLKLPGGRETEARALYLTYRQLASHALSQRLAEELIGTSNSKALEAMRRSLGEENDPRHLAERLFLRFDEKRSETLRRDFQQALALSKRGGVKEAVQHYDRLLSANPYHPQREAMAPFYYQHGKQLLASQKLSEACAVLTKSIHLAPRAPFVADAKARRALALVLSEHDLSAEGAWRLRAALALSPGLDQARELLRNYERKQQLRLWIAGGVGGFAALGLLLGLALLRRRLVWLSS